MCLKSISTGGDIATTDLTMKRDRQWWQIGCLLLLMWPWQTVMSDDPQEPPCIAPPMTLPSTVTDRPPKVIIAHRGASAHLPEHTVPGYRLAMELGADYIEPDLVATRDGQLVAVHSMDLNITTNVDEIFPDRISYSQHLKTDGYFSYNFDLAEILQLRVKQRLPQARSTNYDGKFAIPTFKEILELTLDWNTQIDPLLFNSTFRRAKKGIYAELKDYTWLLEDAKMDLVDLFFEHIDENADLWEPAILDSMCSTKQLRIHEYLLPPLVIQSFEASVLEKFTSSWKTEFKDTLHVHPVPPRTLLVGAEDCLKDNFWFNVGDKWRDFITNVGPDKACLGKEWRLFMRPAIEHRLDVHPWTQRPELEFVESSPPGDDHFESVMEETMRLFCTVGVQGLFSESVSTAFLAAAICTTEDKDGKKRKHGESNSDSSLCFESDREANLYVGIACFVMGSFLSALVSLWCNRNGQERGRRQLRIPTVEVPDHELEMM